MPQPVSYPPPMMYTQGQGSGLAAPCQVSGSTSVQQQDPAIWTSGGPVSRGGAAARGRGSARAAARAAYASGARGTGRVPAAGGDAIASPHLRGLSALPALLVRLACCSPPLLLWAILRDRRCQAPACLAPLCLSAILAANCLACRSPDPNPFDITSSAPFSLLAAPVPAMAAPAFGTAAPGPLAGIAPRRGGQRGGRSGGRGGRGGKGEHGGV